MLDRIPSGKVVLAVSGGTDSISMLHLAWRLSRERQWDIVVVHVQHHLRADESLRDQKFVESFSKRLGISCVVRSINPSEYSKKMCMGIEESSRILRYRELGNVVREIRANAILTAHTANDQAETFFLNLLRGAGTDGLCGILPLRTLEQITGMKIHSRILLIRPLLTFSRKEILRYLHSQGLKFCQDSSNRILKYKRNWIRHKLIPLMEKTQPKILQRVSELTTISQNEKDYWAIQIQKMKRKVIKNPEGLPTGQLLDLILFLGYHVNLRMRLLHHLWPKSSYREIGQILTFIEKEKHKGKKFLSLQEISSQNSFSRQKKEPAGKGCFSLSIPGKNFSKEWGLRVKTERFSVLPGERGFFRKIILSNPWTAYFDADKIRNGNRFAQWQIRSWKMGDRFNPLGMKGSKKIQDLFVDLKVPREKRRQIPLLTVGKKILWVIGYRMDESSKIDLTTKHIIKVQVIPRSI